MAKQPKKRSSSKPKSRTKSRKRSINKPGVLLVLLIIVVFAIIISYFMAGGNFQQYFNQVKEKVSTVSGAENPETSDNSSTTEMTDNTQK